MQVLQLLLVVLGIFSIHAAVQNTVPEPTAGFLQEKEYTYSYKSSVEVYHGTSLNVTAQLSVQTLERDSNSPLELLLNYREVTLTWNTTGSIVTDEKPLGDLSRWFSVSVNENGSIGEVHYPLGERKTVLAFKKTIAQVLTLRSDEVGFERSLDGDVLVVSERQVVGSDGYGEKNVDKTLRFDGNGLLLSAESDERVVQSSADENVSPLLGYPIHSHSTLTLLGVSEVDNEHLNVPRDLSSGTLDIEEILDSVPLSEIHQHLVSLLQCSSTDQESDDCYMQLVSSLRLLSDQDITMFVTQQLDRPEISPLEGQVLINSLSHLGSNLHVGNVLTQQVLRASQRNEELVSQVLVQFASGRILGDRAPVDAVRDLAFTTDDTIPLSLQHQALLALGGMSRKLRESGNTELADEILTNLHSLIQQDGEVDNGEHSVVRLRRSVQGDFPAGAINDAILIDSLGNARSPESLGILVEHLSNSHHSDLSVKHATVNALSGLDAEESAQALLNAAENSPHPTVRHLAAKAYQAHPRKSRDVSHIVQANGHHRSRRQLENSVRPVSNVTMPAVSWNRQFGEPNISVDISRTLRNSFDIDTGTYSSHYTFSLHDDTSFDVNMLLSGGEQHTQMLRTEFCLQGTATYDINILTDFTHNATAHQFNRFSQIVPRLQQTFRDSYRQITTAETGYSGLQSSLQGAVDNVPTRFNQIGEQLEAFCSTLNETMSSFELKTQAERIYSTLNASYTDTRDTALNSLQVLSEAIGAVLPSKPQELSATLSVNGQPYVDSSFYVPYLPYAPQKALANIFEVYRSSETAFNALQSSVEYFQSLSSPYGVNYDWLSPAIFLRSIKNDIASLEAQLLDAIDTADKSPTQSYDGASLSELQTLRIGVANILQPSFEALEGVGDDVITASQDLGSVYQRSLEAFNSFTEAYESARSEVDTVFGQKFHPDFPRQLRDCGSIDESGCGTYPTTSEGLYNDGVDLRVQSQSQVAMPVTGYVQLFNITALPASLQPAYTNYSDSLSVILTPVESSFNGVLFVISNIVPISTLAFSEPLYLKSGAVFATSNDNSTVNGEYFVHIEAIKTVNGLQYVLDPTQFLQPRLDPQVSVDFECNDVVSYVGGVVVDRRNVVPSTTDVITELIGDPLVEGIPGHEFTQPHDLVLVASDSLTSGLSLVQFFQSSTFIMVGPIPVQFDFSSIGSYNYNYSLRANFLSKSLELPLAPYFHARAQGSMRVGNTVFALVDISGTILETVLPLVLTQDFSQWPLVASSTMDIVLVPSTLNLTTQLVQLTGAGEFAEREVLETATVWEYSIPPLNRDEFYYEGSLRDATPPEFAPLAYQTPEQSGCFVRQLPGRAYDNPAFEIDFEVSDLESVLNFTYFVGSYENGDDLIPLTEIGGRHITVPHDLIPARDLYFRIVARNLNGLESIARCSLPNEVYYDRSPPLARINPIRSVSSHRSQISALVALFDEHGLESTQEVAIGLVPGEEGSDVMSWRAFDTALIETPPDEMGDVMNLFSFGRSGRLPGNILEIVPSISDVADCASQCNNREACLSFDYSIPESNCILHSNIEGSHLTSFENIFYTPELQASQSYNHYEKLGVGNSTVVQFSGLSFEHNRVYYINMRLRNRLGYMSVVSSTGFVTDFVPPQPGKIRNALSDSLVSEGCSLSFNTPGCIDEDIGAPNHRIIVDGQGSAAVFNGPTPLLDAMYTSATNYITANWNGFADPESGLYAYTWCVGSQVTMCDVLDPRDPHTRQGLTTRESWTNSGLATSLNLTDGSYFVTVQAISNVEYGGPLATTVHHSTPYIIDTSPPLLTEVTNIEYNITTNELSLNYSASDPGSGIATVSLALGQSQLDTSLLPWTPIDSMGSGTIEVEIPDGVPTWVKLRATNNAGLRTIAVSEETIMVDRSPPLPGRVYDGAMMGSDVDYQSNTTTLCVNFEGFSDPESGIALITWTAGLTAGDSRILSRELTPSEIVSRVACEDGLNPVLNHNTTYYSTLTVYNGAMNSQSVTVSSENGVRIDTTPPLEGIISDGLDPNSDISFSNSFTSVYANWNSYQDFESGIMEYIVTVYQQRYSTSETNAIHVETFTGNSEQASWNHFSFSNGDQIMVQIEAVNGAGLSMLSNSSGYVIDLTPPQVSYIIDGGNPQEDLQYQSSTTSLEASWEVRDDQSGISQIEGAVFEIREGRRMRVYPNTLYTDAQTEIIQSSNFWRVDSQISLQSGSKYIIALFVTNGAGNRVQYESNGVIVDSSPPVVESVSVLSDGYTGDEPSSMVTMITNPSQLELRWGGVDMESGVSHYSVGIVNENGTLVSNFVRFEPTSGGTIDSGLVPGEDLYRAVVIAVNFAGTESEPLYSNVFRVYEGDNAGVVVDGEDPDFIDTDYTDEVTAITAHFYGFSSQLCSGISRYEWAIGEGSNLATRESIMPFTSKGIVTLSSNGTAGYAQTLLPYLKDYENQQLFITVRGITGCGNRLETISNGFRIDTSPPILRVLGTGGEAIERVQSVIADEPVTINRYQNEAGYSSIWSVLDSESGIYNGVDVSIGTYPHGSDINETFNTDSSSLRDQLMSLDGVSSYLTLTARNGANLRSVVVSDPLVLDTTPPLYGELSCSGVGRPLPLTVWNAQENTGYIYCNWNGVYDFESGITQYAVSIGRSPTDQSSLSKTPLAGKTNIYSYHSPKMNFEPDVAYYVVLYALNGAGLETVIQSNPVYFDLSPPRIDGTLRVVPNFVAANYDMDVVNLTSSSLESAVCLWDTDVITLVFAEPRDPEVGNNFRYEIGVGFVQGGDDISNYEAFEPSQLPSNTQQPDMLYHLLNPINFPRTNQQQGVYFNIKIYNSEGLYSTLTSNAVYIKSYLNQDDSWIFDGGNIDRDIDYQTSITEASAHFYFGVNCPIRAGQWAIESVDGMFAQGYTQLDTTRDSLDSNLFFVSTDRVNLFNDETYRVLVQVVDFSGEVHILRSNGTSVTSAALRPGLVQDGAIPNQDLNYQESLTMLWARWSGFGDGTPEQQISYYEVAAGSDREYPGTRTDIAPFTNVGLNASHTFTDLILIPETVTYYITVRAFAVSGAYIEATSNGIAAGFGHSIIPGEITLNRYQTDISTVSVYWTPFQSDLPIRLYEWAVGTRYFDQSELERFCEDTDSDYATYFDVFGFTNVNLDTTATQADLNLQHNATYYVIIRAIDQAKKCISVISPEGLTVDLTPPDYNDSPTTVVVGSKEFSQNENSSFVIYLRPNEQLDVTWEAFYDAQSEIDYYSVGVFAQSECNNNSEVSLNAVVEFMNVGREQQAAFFRVDFEDGISYVVAVRATNFAGLQGTAYSQPIVLASSIPIGGTVKDGLIWENDVTFQSDLSTLSAVFTHAKLPSSSPGVTDESGPCPNTTFYPLTSLDPSWTRIDPASPVGPYSSRILYQQAQVLPSSEQPGINIVSETDSDSSRVVSGGYRTSVPISNGGTVRFNMHTAQGTPDYETNAVTAVLLIDGGRGGMESDTIALFDPNVPDFQYTGFNAFGLQIYSDFLNETITESQSVVMWASADNPLQAPVFIHQSIPQLDLTTDHVYELTFKTEQLDVSYQQSVDLKIDGELVASLHGLPQLTDDTQLVFHVFNRQGYVSPILNQFDIPTVTAIFGNVSLPLQVGHICDFGMPFFSGGSPVVEFRAGIGTTPGDTDVRALESINYPCIPCMTTACPYHGCEENCTEIDPYEIPITFNNLTLYPGYIVEHNQTLVPGRGELDNQNTLNTMLSTLTSHFQPSVYYITVQATTASGRRVSATSNGVTIDTTPPEIVSPIEHFDVSFSTTEPTLFQGNDSVIAARWSFRDLQSNVVEYLWAIGSSPFSDDVQSFVSVGLSTETSNQSLFGIIEHNTTYYVTVIAVNGAGLRTSVSSSGITYIATELNVTELERFVIVESVEVLRIGGVNETIEEVLRTIRDDRAAIEWEGVGEDVQEIFWRIGSVRRGNDVLPSTEVSFNSSQSAIVEDGILYLNGVPFANISEIIALDEGKEEDPSDNSFFFEPGRLLYNSLEFCNFVHRCSIVETLPSIVIRSKDVESDPVVEDIAAISLVAMQQVPQGVDQSNLAILDKAYNVSLKTSGLEQGSQLYAGFFNQSDITQRYRAAMPYISNPFITMSQTSREIARRFTEFGGPSFYISFLGQESLNAPIEINATFDQSLDWTLATPEIAYWDNEQELWREVSATCMNNSRIDWTTNTIAVEVCSTVLSEEMTSLQQRRRRQTDPLDSSGLSGMGASGSGSGIGVSDDGNTDGEYLDRPTQFIVIGIGNISTNTPPTLEIPTDPLQVTEDGGTTSFELEFTDLEGDIVDFYLTSSPLLGEVTLSLDGVLSYTPCQHCTGLDTLQVYIIERQFGASHTPLTDTGEIRIQINNLNDQPEIYFYEDTVSSNEVTLNDSVYVFIDSNRVSPAILTRVAAFDFDGYNDDLQISVRDGQYGSAGFQVWLDAVNVPESLPISISENTTHDLQSFRSYITFLGVYITYLPFDPSFNGTDEVRVLVFDSNGVQSRTILVMVEVLPSLCENDGTCSGSVMDPNCTDIEARRGSFDGYNCSCLPGYGGQYCEIQLGTPEPLPMRDCPPGVPVVQCDGDPCREATCPSHPTAECRPNYCGSCKPEWYIGDTLVTCTVDASACDAPNVGVPLAFCADRVCPCVLPPYPCPEDSILVERRVDACCVNYECVCPNTSCPLLMECGQGVQPVPNYRGNGFPGRCCPEYDYEDINECMVRSENLCSDVCVDESSTYSCDCPTGTTLAQDGFNCGVCPHNGMEYLFGDRVKIGCNWCICRGDDLSGERWHCTAETCDRGCLRDRQYYEAGSTVTQGTLTCSCELTDTNAMWECELNV